jgi:hypothetical protein
MPLDYYLRVVSVSPWTYPTLSPHSPIKTGYAAERLSPLHILYNSIPGYDIRLADGIENRVLELLDCLCIIEVFQDIKLQFTLVPYFRYRLESQLPWVFWLENIRHLPLGLQGFRVAALEAHLEKTTEN